MSKKIYLYGNWKMNMTVAETKDFFNKLNSDSLFNEYEGSSSLGALYGKTIHSILFDENSDLEIGIFAPFTSLWAAAEGAEGKGIIVGAQNIYYEPKGAFTGEVSISMIKEAGATHVILGHSERRHIFNESDELIAKKTKAALDAGLIPVLCYGETLDERESGHTFDVMTRQLKSALGNLTPEEVHKIIYAYEPVWAIGTGKSATSEQAQEVCEWSRKLINDPKAIILYGGSVKGSNAKELLSMKDIDGALVGGASLKPHSFLEIYGAFKG